jgi:hypothetical protein
VSDGPVLSARAYGEQRDVVGVALGKVGRAARTRVQPASLCDIYAVGEPVWSPSRWMVASRILNFWILPVTVMGNSSVMTR